MDNQLQEPILTDGMTANVPMPETIEIQNQTQNIPPEHTESVVSDIYTPDEFFENFKSVFKFVGDTTGTESFEIKEREMAGARITSNRLYSMAEKYAFMRPLISKNTTHAMETIIMIQFVVGKASDVYKEKTNVNLGGIVWKKAKKMLGIKTAKDTGFLGHPDAVKQQKPETSSANQTV